MRGRTGSRSIHDIPQCRFLTVSLPLRYDDHNSNPRIPLRCPYLPLNSPSSLQHCWLGFPSPVRQPKSLGWRPPIALSEIPQGKNILFQISNAKSNGSPNFVIKALVRELLLSDLKENKDAKAIVDYIMKKDKLITFGTSDLKDARIIYGADITQREQIIHDNGLDILLELLASGKNVENIDAEFEAEIAKYITPELNLTPNVGL